MLSSLFGTLMKLLFLLPAPFYTESGEAGHARTMIQTLKEAGHKVDVLCYPAGSDLPLEGVRVFRAGFRWMAEGHPALMARCLLDAAMLGRAVLLCLASRYDAVHALQEGVFMGKLLRRLFGVGLVYDLRVRLSDKARQNAFPFMRWAARWLDHREAAAVRRAHLVLALCSSLSEWVRAEAPSTPVFQIGMAPLNPGFSPDREGALRLRHEGALGGRPVLLCLDLFGRCDGADLFVKAARIASRTHPEAVFIAAAGDGGQLRHLKKIAQRLDLGDGFQGWISPTPSALPAWLTLADVLVSPRVSGRIPPVELISLMQTGKPLVATRLPPHADLLDESCALLTSPQPDDLAAGMVRALEEPLLMNALGREAQARVASGCNLASFRHKVRMAYQELALR